MKHWEWMWFLYILRDKVKCGRWKRVWILKDSMKRMVLPGRRQFFILHILQACCTAPNSLHTRCSWKCYRGFLQTQRRPWNFSKPWCFHQLGKGIHLTSWKDRTISPYSAALEKGSFTAHSAAPEREGDSAPWILLGMNQRDGESCILLLTSDFSSTKGSCS